MLGLRLNEWGIDLLIVQNLLTIIEIFCIWIPKKSRFLVSIKFNQHLSSLIYHILFNCHHRNISESYDIQLNIDEIVSWKYLVWFHVVNGHNYRVLRDHFSVKTCSMGKMMNTAYCNILLARLVSTLSSMS